MNDAFSQNRELLLDERILGIATAPRRVTGCACGGVPLMYVSRRTGTGLGRGRARRGRSEVHGARTRTGRGCTAHPRHLVTYTWCSLSAQGHR